MNSGFKSQVVPSYRLLTEELQTHPERLFTVRGNPKFKAYHHRDVENDRYDLIIVEDDGSKRLQRVRVVEVRVVVAH